jgi:HSP20 family protein
LVDITEDDKEYLIKAELPEIKKEEIKVTVENGVLVISGERKLEKEEKSARPKQIEVEAATGNAYRLPAAAWGGYIRVSFGQCLNVLGKED